MEKRIPCTRKTRKGTEEPVSTRFDVDINRAEVKHTIENFNDKKATGIDGIIRRI
jgi:hypothetical protein